MVSPTQHLLYPSPPTPEAFAKDPLLWREGRDPLIERLLTTRSQPTDSGWLFPSDHAMVAARIRYGIRP